jgi:hypothetical protein
LDTNDYNVSETAGAGELVKDDIMLDKKQIMKK